MPHIIAPSLLSANFLALEADINLLESSAAQWLHLDVMDGVFVPNISFGTPVIKAVKAKTSLFLDTHLMLVNPDAFVPILADIGVDCITVHAEACTHLHRSLQLIKSHGIKAGVALNPHTPIATIECLAQEIDLVCLMSVNPGFGGQKFIPYTFEKLKQLAAWRAKNHASFLIEIDGGVGLHNHKALVAAGVDVLVAGNAVFGSENPLSTIQQLAQI